MPVPAEGTASRLRDQRVLRGGALGLAVVLAAAGIWLIASSGSQRPLAAGVLLGLWGAVLGAFALFGARPAAGTAPPGPAGSALDVRGGTELERLAAAAARREFEAGLQRLLELLGREPSPGAETEVVREIGALRAEVIALRHDLVEKVGGELRLERIETTRLIGSDLEAVQRELRRLRSAEDGGAARARAGLGAGSSGAEVEDAEVEDAVVEVEDAEDAEVRDAEVQDAEVEDAEDAEVRDAEVQDAEVQDAEVVGSRSGPDRRRPAPLAPPSAGGGGTRRRTPPSRQRPVSRAEPQRRLRWGRREPRRRAGRREPRRPVSRPAAAPAAVPAGAAAPAEGPAAAAPATSSARSRPRAGAAAGAGPAPGPVPDAEPVPEPPALAGSGRRHRAADDGGNDVLARILARERR